mgnify:CR=1 FL=1
MLKEITNELLGTIARFKDTGVNSDLIHVSVTNNPNHYHFVDAAIKELLDEKLITATQVRKGNTFGETDISIMYALSPNGFKVTQNGGYIEYLDSLEKKQNDIEEKFQSELAFAKASNELLPFQKKNTIFTTIVTSISLLVVIISTLQTCAINVTSNQDKGHGDDILELKRKNIELNYKLDSLLNKTKIGI